MKIMMFCDFYGLGQTYQENLLTKYYISLGHQVVVLSTTTTDLLNFVNGIHDNSIAGSTEYEFGAKIIRLQYSINIKNKIKNFRNVKSILDEKKPDLIFAHDIYFNLNDAVKYKKKYGCKIILDYHADFTNSGKNWVSINILHKLIRKTYLQKHFKFIDKIYGVTPESQKFLKDIYCISLKDTELLPLGCDYEAIQNVCNNTDKDLERKKLGIGKDDIVIICGGKFNLLKNTHLTIDVLKILNNKKIHLLLFGKADFGFESYEQEMKKSAEGYNVHFLGWLNSDEAYKYMAISDIALFPSSQSVLWQQCIGAHLPLITGDSGQQDMSYLNRNQNLIKVEKDNLNSNFLSTIIQNLIENPSKLQKMKRGAEKTAKEYLDYKIIAQRTLM